ncbi:MAG: signal recognition particle-docking protein FtsY [Gammaproteobacteria bacterium]|nr:signal recognition particle-docking protein FtsY [Gammaproteobacteria bacterium]
MGIFSFLKRQREDREDSSTDAQPLDRKLERTRGRFRDGLLDFFKLNQRIDESLFEELENQLIMADVGVQATQRIMDSLRDRVKSNADTDALRGALREELLAILTPVEQPLEIADTDGPFVILVVGVNGSGKTTTIGKLARQLLNGGQSVMLAAGDTFRAAAIEQLQTWGERNGVPVISQDIGSDSASVIFDALQSAKARNIDVLIADTAGRLHTQSGLMDELSKVKRVLGKLDQSAPHETLIVLDGGTGQNALNQAQQFNEVMQLSGMVVTKLDGTAKGGIVFAIAEKMNIPIRFIGVGEQVADLEVFEAERFVDALIATEESSAQ